MARKSKPASTRKASPTAKTAKKTKRMSTKPAARPTADKGRADKPSRRQPPATHKLVWRGVTCRVRHTRNYISPGWSHLEIILLAPMDAPLPITRTGYLSHFLDEEELAKAGGPVAFFLAWLDREARTSAWAKAEFTWRQLELFPR